MKNKQKQKSRRIQPKSKLRVLRQVCELIPPHLVVKLAREHGVDAKARSYTVWSHVVSLVFAQLSAAVSLNDVCDNLRVHSGGLSSVRGAKAPARNTLSHANKSRDAAMAEALFWAVLAHLRERSPGFGSPRKRRRGLPARFRRTIHAMDSTTIQLVANCLDWARHRRRKAAAKCHLRLNLQSFLPEFAVVDTARQSDNRRARELCAGLRAGEIGVFDKAYIDFEHLYDLDRRGVFWVTRAKDNMACDVIEHLPEGSQQAKILSDEIVVLTGARSQEAYPEPLRRVRALVEVDGKEVEMVFLTNNFQWAPTSICDLYRCRWDIEVFFKQIKQNLKLCDFLGHSANAVRWQVWVALLVYVLLRYFGFLSGWAHSFSRLCTLVRALLWDKLALRKLLVAYGTAGGSFRMLGRPDQAYLPGFEPACGTANNL